MLRGLSDLGELKFVDLVAIEEVVEGECETRLKSCGRAEARSERHVAREDSVKALYVASALLDFAAYTEDVACPRFFRGIFLLEAELHIFVDIDGEDSDFLKPVGTDHGHDDLVDSTREYEPAVVVGVLADEVDSSCGSIDVAFSAETVGEDFLKIFLHFFSCHDC